MNRLFALVVGFAAGAVSGAPTNAVTVLKPVVVYGSRLEATADELPSAVQVMDASEIRSSGARDLADLLGKRAGLHVRTLNANPFQAQLAMGGFGENSFGRIKIVVDGEELDSVDMEAPNLAGLPMGSLERVEVIRGASPVLYGDGAVAGVINVTTDSLDYSPRTRLSAKAGSYGTAGLSFDTRGGFEDEAVAYSAAYGYDRSDGYRNRSGYDSHAFDASIRHDFESGSSIRLKTDYANARYQMPGALSLDDWRDDPRRERYDDDWCRLWNFGFQLAVKAVLADDQRLYLDGAYTRRHRTSHWDDYGYENDYDLDGFRLSTRYVNEKPIGSFDNRATAGFDFAYDHDDVTDRSGFNNPDYAFARARYGLFGRDEFALTESLSLVAGARVEAIENRWTHYRGLAQTSSQDVTGDYELGLVYRPFDGVKTFVKGVRYHRSAFCDELNYTEDGKFLRPETGTALDFGVDARFADEFLVDASGYWSVIDDEIFYNPHAKEFGGGVWGGYNCNSPDRTERLGFDAGLAWRREKTAEASLRGAFVDARFKHGSCRGEHIPLVPSLRVSAEAGVWLVDDLEVKGGVRYVSDQVLAGDFENEQDRLSGYTLFGLDVVYTPSWAEGWRLAFSVDNLFDRRYCDFAGWSDYSGGYCYPACGRSFLVTIGYEF